MRRRAVVAVDPPDGAALWVPSVHWPHGPTLHVDTQSEAERPTYVPQALVNRPAQVRPVRTGGGPCGNG